MNKSILKIIFIITGIVILTGYVVFAVLSFYSIDDEIVCKDLIISFPFNEKNKLYSKNDISAILDDANLHPIGESYKDVKTEKIEKKLRSLFLINYAECFKTPSGKVYLMLKQRTPKYIITGAKSYYIDTERKLMPTLLDHTVYLPVVSGYITKSMAEGELFDFVSFLEENSFWNSQIEQIYVNKNLTVELVPRVGNAVIKLGKLENFTQKLEKLKLLYAVAFSQIGWSRYEIIDLQYNNQIVCYKSEQKKLPVKQILIQKTDTITKKL